MTTVPINDLSRSDNTEREQINARIQDVVKSGYFMLGSNTKELEVQLGQRLGGMKVVCVGNGTDALTISILGLGLQAGSKIATVANAGGYSTGAILRVGCTPVLVDVASSTAQMSPDSLKKMLAQHTDIKAVIVTHLFGLMAEIAEISEMAKEHNVLLIEDCAQAVGASVGGHEAGSWGDASTFSFYPTKNLGCLGDGGAVAFRRDADLAKGRSIAQYGWSERYVISDENGFNTRLDEIQAVVLLERLKSLQANNVIRRSIVRKYAKALPATHRMIWQDNESYVGHLAIVVGPDRTHIQKVLGQHEVGHGIHYPLTDNQQPAWKKNLVDASVPNCEALAEQIVTVPCFPGMTESEINQVCVALSSL